MDPFSPTQGPARKRLYRAPMSAVALALAGGITAGRYGPLPTGLWFAFGAAGLLVAWATALEKRWHLATCLAAGAVVFALGAVHVRLVYFTADADHVVSYTARSDILATLRGRVVTWPAIYRSTDQPFAGYVRPPRTTFLLQAEALRTRQGWRRATGLVRVTIECPDDRIAAGQELELLGKLGRFNAPANPGEYDQAQAARNRHLLARMSVPAAGGAIIRGGARQPWYVRAIWKLRAASRQHLAGCGDEEAGRLLNALILGERHPALRSLNRTMVRAGIAHFLSISGLHLGVFLGFVYMLCRLAALAPRRAAGVVLAVLAMYLLLAEPRAPLLRSAIMAAALCLAVILQRRHAALNSLAVAGVVLLAADPLQLFEPGFQLSFAIVAGLILLHQPLRDLLFGRWLRQRGLMVFRDDQRLRRWLYYRAGDGLTHLVTMCLVAYLLAAPLVAHHFDLFSPYAPILTVLLFPLVLAVLIPGYVSIALTWPAPNLAYQVGRLAAGAGEALAQAVRAIGRLPGAGFELRPVGPAWVLLCYAVIALAVLCRRMRFGRLAAAAGAVGLIAATVLTQRTAPAPRTAELDILSVGAGQCAILRTPRGATYLFDAGTQSGFDAYQQTLEPFLRARRLPAPVAAFVSHANTDHYNAVPPLVRRGRLKKAFLNRYFGDEPDPEAPQKRLLHLFAENGLQIVHLHAGMTVALDDRTRVQVLWPPPQRREDLSVNDTSLVLRIVCDSRSVLLTGDIEATVQSELLAEAQALASDALVLPHHGTWSEPLPAFVAAVAPRIVMVSSARHPHAPLQDDGRAGEFYARLQAAYRYYNTPRNGWIHLEFGRERLEARTMR